ncbi:MAG: OsmC family protein [Bradyrhizobium sp.]
MELAKFKATQEPIKALYGKDAKAAFLTLKATGSASDSTVTCKVETGNGLALAGIHPKAGGTGQELCSGDMLLEALVACAGVSMRAAAAVLEIPIKSATVSAEGDVDLRGTLGVTEGVPVGFKEIRLRFDIDSEASRDQLNQLIELTDRYCVIFQTIQNSPGISLELNRVGEE